MQPHVCIANRNSYTFPPAHLLRISAAVPGSVTWAGRHYQPYPSGRSGIVATSLALDNFHRVLLNSATSDDRVDGVVSVVYWGNSAGANGARTGLGLPRAKWILEGKVRDRLVMRPTPALTIANTVEAARIRIHAGDSAAALSLLQGISFLGWSFASKVAAFLDPTHCGVLDKVIARHLRASKSHALNGIKMNPAGFKLWCTICSDAALRLNGSGHHWVDWDGSLQQWRAIDVERVVFRAAVTSSDPAPIIL